LTALTSPARGGGEFENFGNSVIAHEDTAPHERDLEFEDGTIPPLPLPLLTSLQEEVCDAGDAAKPPDETIALPEAEAEDEREHEYGRSGGHLDDTVMNADRSEASEVLRMQAEEAQSLNVALELTLDGEGGQQFAWINPTWYDTIRYVMRLVTCLVMRTETQNVYFPRRTDPDMLLGMPIADHLAPADANMFREAVCQLQDDLHMLEVQFCIKVKPKA
jgi:hypothetical protein